MNSNSYNSDHKHGEDNADKHTLRCQNEPDVEGDRYVLTSKIIDMEISDLQRRMHLLDEARRKGGVTVVALGNTVITTYRTDSLNAKYQK